LLICVDPCSSAANSPRRCYRPGTLIPKRLIRWRGVGSSRATLAARDGGPRRTGCRTKV